MAITTRCCLSIIPPPPTNSSLSSSSTKNTTQVAWFKNQKWRNGCALGMACMMIIGLEMENIGNEGNFAMAMENSLASTVESKDRRWSDKRMCPPWRLNSLETIVPENLPRPSARRRWEATTDYSKVAPPPSVKAKAESIMIRIMIRSNCFTM